MPRKPTNPDRPPVTRERALDAAMTVADRDGIEALTMRRVASELGVEAMSLYYHVANKDELLDGMVDRVFAEIEVPAPGGDWVAGLRHRAHSARAALMRHPWAVNLLDSRRTPGPATMGHHEAMIALERAAGLSMALCAHIGALLDAYIYGFVMQEVALPFSTGEEAQQVAGDAVGSLPVEIYPNIHAFYSEHVMQMDYDFAAEFDFGLDLILRGLQEAAAAEQG